MPEVTEGAVTVEVPEQPESGAGESVFYNPRMELNRDLTVATLRALRAEGIVDSDDSTYLDAMAATGLRGIRAAAEGWDATLCDVDSDAVELCAENAARNDLDVRTHHGRANPLMYNEWFDVVDLDPFGTPIPFADAAFNSARSVVCVTATDTAPLCGAHFESGVRTYGAVPRNTEFHAEMGLRVLLSALVRTAARYDVAATPILSHVSDHYVRTYLSLERGATPANAAIDELGYVYWCQTCLYRETDPGLVADPVEGCPHCGRPQVVPAGPLWLGQAHDPAFVDAVRGQISEEMATETRARRLTERIEGELHEPTHYDQHRLYDRWNESAIAMDDFLDALREEGHDASRAHYGGTTFKTTASLGEIRAAVLD